MTEQTERTVETQIDAPSALVSRRSLLGGILAAAVAPAFIKKTWAQPGLVQTKTPKPHAVPAIRSGSIGVSIPRHQHAATGLGDGRILVTGGWRHACLTAYVPPLADSQIYDPGKHSWEKTGSLSTARAQHAAVTLSDGRVMVVGGMSHAPLASTEIYDPNTRIWSSAAPMEQPRYGHAATCQGGLVIVTGGFNQGALSSLQIYDIATDTWHLAR